MSEFLNSNNIFEFQAPSFPENLTLKDIFYQSLKVLKLKDEFIDINFFK
jgi:hypothetical protein